MNADKVASVILSRTPSLGTGEHIVPSPSIEEIVKAYFETRFGPTALIVAEAYIAKTKDLIAADIAGLASEDRDDSSPDSVMGGFGMEIAAGLAGLILGVVSDSMPSNSNKGR